MTEAQTINNKISFNEFFLNQMELIKDERVTLNDKEAITYSDLCIDESIENAKKKLFKNPEDLPEEFKDICDKYFKIYTLRHIDNSSYGSILENLYKLYYLYEQYNEFKNNANQIGKKEIESGFFKDKDIENTNIFENGKVEAITTDLHGSMNAAISFLLESGVAKFKDGEKSFVFFDMYSKKSYNSIDDFLEQNSKANIEDFRCLTLIPNLELNKDYKGVAINCGDLVDRGSYTDQVVAIFSYLEEQEKNELPENKKLIRLCGNHEVAELFNYQDHLATFNDHKELFLRDILDDKVRLCYADNGILYSHTLLDPIDLSNGIKYIENFKKEYPDDFKNFFGENFDEKEFNELKKEINRVALDSFLRDTKSIKIEDIIENKELFNNLKLKDKSGKEFDAIELINNFNTGNKKEEATKFKEFKTLLKKNGIIYENLTFQNIEINNKSINSTDLFPKYFNQILKIHAVQQLIIRERFIEENADFEDKYFDKQKDKFNKKIIEETFKAKFPNYEESKFFKDYKENGKSNENNLVDKKLEKFFYQGDENGIFANRALTKPTYKAGYGHSIMNGKYGIRNPIYKNKDAIGLCFDNGQNEGNITSIKTVQKTHAICFKTKGNEGKPQTIFTEIDASLKYQCEKNNSLLNDEKSISNIIEKEKYANLNKKIIIDKEKAEKERKNQKKLILYKNFMDYKYNSEECNKILTNNFNDEELYTKIVSKLFEKAFKENDNKCINNILANFVEKINNNTIKKSEFIKTFIMISEYVCKEKNSNKKSELDTEFINNINEEKIQEVFGLAYKNGNLNLIDNLLSNSNLVEIKAEDKEKLLNDAITKNNIEMAKVFIKNGFRIESKQLKENEFKNIKNVLTILAEKHNIDLKKFNKIKLKTKRYISKNKKNYTYLDNKDFNELSNLLDTISNMENNKGHNI